MPSLSVIEKRHAMRYSVYPSPRMPVSPDRTQPGQIGAQLPRRGSVQIEVLDPENLLGRRRRAGRASRHAQHEGSRSHQFAFLHEGVDLVQRGPVARGAGAVETLQQGRRAPCFPGFRSRTKDRPRVCPREVALCPNRCAPTPSRTREPWASLVTATSSRDGSSATAASSLPATMPARSLSDLTMTSASTPSFLSTACRMRAA